MQISSADFGVFARTVGLGPETRSEMKIRVKCDEAGK